MNEKSEADLQAIYLFNEGTNSYSYKLFGCKSAETGFLFTVYAPNALQVSIVGSFNDWNTETNPAEKIHASGIWQARVANAQRGDIYKYAIKASNGALLYKADPYATRSQLRPETASVVWEVEDYSFSDADFIQAKAKINPYTSPMSIYEVHLGSFKAEKNLYELTYDLIPYVVEMGYTHIELMPVAEFPLDDSWGYQITGYFSVSSRYGTPWDLKNFVNECHKNGISVILDWVPAHFTRDSHGLRLFDGEPLYENKDKRRGEQPQWQTQLFDFEKPQVVSFLISNAIFFLKEFHIDGLRVDAVSCMLYHDYGKASGQWLPNRYGGNENLEAIAFLRSLSRAVARECPNSLLIAEESTAFPLVTKPPEVGGLGFNFKWNMGFMNDTLEYMQSDPLFRKNLHGKLTFSMLYAFSENYILPFSHDEVVHGKKSLIDKMPGTYEQKFAQLKLLFMYQYAHPGKKLMFMGQEFGQFIEWNFRQSLDFCLLEYDSHYKLREFVKKLNGIYKNNSPFFACDTGWNGFSWLVVDDNNMSVAAFMRSHEDKHIICVFNFTPVNHEKYRLKLPFPMKAIELLNSNSTDFGGNGELSPGMLLCKENESGYYIDLPLAGFEGIYLMVC